MIYLHRILSFTRLHTTTKLSHIRSNDVPLIRYFYARDILFNMDTKICMFLKVIYMYMIHRMFCKDSRSSYTLYLCIHSLLYIL